MEDVGSGLSGIRVGFVISGTIHPLLFFFFLFGTNALLECSVQILLKELVYSGF